MSADAPAGLLDPDAGAAAVADEILGALAEGPGPWRMPWHGLAELPSNPMTGRPFRGTNIITLWAAHRRRGYRSHYWAGEASGAAVAPACGPVPSPC